MQEPTAVLPADGEAPAAPARLQRIESLDSLRGLAALAVLLSHTMGGWRWGVNTSWVSLPLVNMIFDGRSAVTMFFVLSGFVLARPYVAKGNRPARTLVIPTFYLRRFTRIWIPWLVVFCFSALAQAYFFQSPSTVPPLSEWMGSFWHQPLTLSSFLKQCVFSLHQPKYLLLNQDWSLGVELKCSVLLPLFLFLVLRRPALLLGFSILLVLLVSTGMYYFSFILGVLAAEFLAEKQLPLKALPFSTKFGLLAFGVILYHSRLGIGAFWEITSSLEEVVWVLASVGCVLILVASLSSARIEAVLSRPALVFLGRISFSVYLLQFVVLLCVIPPVIQGLNQLGLHHSGFLLPLILTVSVFSTVVLGAISYRWVELPSISFGNWLAKTFGGLLAGRVQTRP